MRFEFDLSMLNNNLLFSILGGLISVLITFIDKCVCVKDDTQVNYISYIKTFILVFSICYLFLNLRPDKTETNNKILLKNLLEGLDMELPEELKAIDSSSTDPQKLS